MSRHLSHTAPLPAGAAASPRRFLSAWRPAARGAVALLLWATASVLGACPAPSGSDGSPEPAAASPLPAEAPREALPSSAPGTVAEGPEPPSADAAAAADEDAVPAWAERALDLEALLGREGWARDADVRADTFVISPEGTRVAAGRFSAGEHAGAVAVFVYPNERFARPHAVDLRERMRLVPQGLEVGLREGPAVVHIRGDDPASARALASVLSSALGAPGVSEGAPAP